MALQLNQTGISPQAGDGVYAPYPARSFKLANTLEAPCGPCTPCKLAGVASTGMPVVTPITAETDVVYCVLAYGVHNNSFAANSIVKGWVSDEVVWMSASAAIASGALVSAGVDGTVATAAGGNAVLGIAESSAAGAGNLVAVRLTSPYAVQGAE